MGDLSARVYLHTDRKRNLFSPVIVKKMDGCCIGVHLHENVEGNVDQVVFTNGWSLVRCSLTYKCKKERFQYKLPSREG